MLKRVEISVLLLIQPCFNDMVKISTWVKFGIFLPCNLNIIFNLPWNTSNCVKIVQNLVEVKRIKLKCKHKKINNTFQNTYADKLLLKI